MCWPESTWKRTVTLPALQISAPGLEKFTGRFSESGSKGLLSTDDTSNYRRHSYWCSDTPTNTHTHIHSISCRFQLCFQHRACQLQNGWSELGYWIQYTESMPNFSLVICLGNPYRSANFWVPIVSTWVDVFSHLTNLTTLDKHTSGKLHHWRKQIFIRKTYLPAKG